DRRRQGGGLQGQDVRAETGRDGRYHVGVPGRQEGDLYGQEREEVRREPVRLRGRQEGGGQGHQRRAGLRPELHAEEGRQVHPGGREPGKGSKKIDVESTPRQEVTARLVF